MTPKAIVNAIEARLGVTGTPRQLRDAIEVELLGTGVNAASSAEQADSLRDRVIAEIVRRRDEQDESGEIAIVDVQVNEDQIVFGASHVFNSDNEQIKRAKINRVVANEINEYMKNLTFAQFERLGKSVIRELGSVNAKITSRANDQGIDFYGDISVGSLMGADPTILRLMHETKVVLVGQAKHYPASAIGPSVVRELVGALSLARTYTYSRETIDLLNNVQLRPFSPLLALLFSTGKFTKGARYLAKRAGLIAFSGWQLAIFLADRGVGIVSEGDTVRFDNSVFDAWLS